MTSPAIVPLPNIRQPFILFLRQLWAIFIRHAYLYIGSFPRLLQLIYWPIINILSWGFASFYIVNRMTGLATVGNVLIAGVLLNEVFARTNQIMTILFLEEFWSRNLGHLFASPIKIFEYSLGLIITALVCSAIGVIPAMVMAWWLFGFSVLSFGLPLIAFLILLLLNGFWYSLLILAMLFRYGQAAEWLGWMSVLLLTPFIAPFYPVSILPHAMQYVSWSIPATYVFECIKDIINGHTFPINYLWIALGLNIVYFAIAGFVFYQAYLSAKKRGGILQVGE